jgi:hypothetical protein
VVCIALGVDRGDLLFGGGPCPPLYSLEDRVKLDTSLGVLPEYFSGCFLLFRLVLLLVE